MQGQKLCAEPLIGVTFIIWVLCYVSEYSQEGKPDFASGGDEHTDALWRSSVDYLNKSEGYRLVLWQNPENQTTIESGGSSAPVQLFSFFQQRLFFFYPFLRETVGAWSTEFWISVLCVCSNLTIELSRKTKRLNSMGWAECLLSG